MARNLWRPTRFGLPGPVVGILAVVVVLLIAVILWVRNGCQAAPEPEETVPAIPEAVSPVGPGPEEPEATEPAETGIEPAHIEVRTPDIYDKYWEAGLKAFDQQDYVNARAQLAQALKGPSISAERKKMIQVQMSSIAKELTFSRHVMADDKTVELYHVKSGDYPAGVAKKFNITAGLFMKINGIADPTRMRADKSYKVIKGPFDVVVHKKTFRLEVFLGDYYIKGYSIGLGRDNSTPTGVFLTGSKLPDPNWRAPADASGRRELVRHGDPRNPLGNHWISLMRLPEEGGKLSDSDYGIHGTNEPQTIGKQASHGCIRMRNEKVADVFDLLVTGKSRIRIMAD